MIDIDSSVMVLFLVGITGICTLLQYGLVIVSKRTNKRRYIFVLLLLILLLGFWSFLAIFNPMLPYPNLFKDKSMFAMPDGLYGLISIFHAFLGYIIGIALGLSR